MTVIDQPRSVAAREPVDSIIESPPDARIVRCAIVGAGKMGQHHARAIRRLATHASLVAVADPESAARDAMRGIWPGTSAFLSLEELLGQVAVDAVHVCTSLDTHAELATLALEAGCHAYVEKPFAGSTQTTERLLALARSKNLILCAGHQLLYQFPARRALQLLPALGRLVHIESYFSFRTVRRSAVGRAPLRADLQLLDILPHPVSLLLRFLEETAPDARCELIAGTTNSAGTVHALLRRGGITGTLTVTLEGRPVESDLRLIGANGTVHADFVRGTVQRLIGPGTSGIDKALNPLRLARQLFVGTIVALGGRVLRRERSYPGLTEILKAFYEAILNSTASPTSPEHILETVRVWEEIAATLDSRADGFDRTTPAANAPSAVVTGGTGFFGKEIVRSLRSHGFAVRVIARREPASWELIPGATYIRADLSECVNEAAVRGIDVLIHCAAETAGGWAAHQKNSVNATENVLRAAAAAGVKRVIYVSSLSVLASPIRHESITEDSPLEPRTKERGPYVWGKVESERLATRLAPALGLELKIVRPGALVDYRAFEPPGRLGKRLGNIFVAVGSPTDSFALADVRFAAEVVTWMAREFADAPSKLHLLAPTLPTKKELIARLKRSNPDLTVIWMPHRVLILLSWIASGLQKVLRPRKPVISVARVFAQQRCDTSRIARLAAGLLAHAPEP